MKFYETSQTEIFYTSITRKKLLHILNFSHIIIEIKHYYVIIFYRDVKEVSVLIAKVKYCRVFFFDEKSEQLKEVVYLGSRYKIGEIKKKTNKKPVKVENSTLQVDIALKDVDKSLFQQAFGDDVVLIYEE